ncbi:MAG: cation transporter, partial [Planctomycetes bacterium]|nr:cation transporter [Planctomycetota bacterium]
LWSYAVLGLAFVFESGSCAVALREFRNLRGGRPALEAILETRDPTVPVVLLEDLAALVGLALALSGVALSHATGWGGWDGIASVLIGLLLCGVAVLLARETHSLLLGESATEEDLREVRRLVEETPGVRRLTQLRSMHRGPKDVLLALKVDLGRGLSVAEVESTIDRLEARVRGALPQMRHIFVEPDASGGRDAGGPEGR